MKLATLFSGGKDSTYSAYLGKKQGHEIACLVSMRSKNPHSYMFHTPSISMAKKQAEAMQIPLIEQETEGEKEEELKDLKEAIMLAVKEYSIEGVATGAVESAYQATRIQKICDELKLEVFNPLWHKNTENYWKEMLDLGFKVIIVGVAAEGLGKEWLGKEIDKDSLEELKMLSQKYRFHLGFEGGEAETFVTDCPLFKKKLKIISADKVWNGNSGIYEIKDIKLIDK